MIYVFVDFVRLARKQQRQDCQDGGDQSHHTLNFKTAFQKPVGDATDPFFILSTVTVHVLLTEEDVSRRTELHTYITNDKALDLIRFRLPTPNYL